MFIRPTHKQTHSLTKAVIHFYNFFFLLKQKDTKIVKTKVNEMRESEISQFVARLIVWL